MEWRELVPYIFGFMALSIAGWVAKSINDLNNTVKELIVAMTVQKTTQEAHEKRFEIHETRITRLEDRRVE